MYEYIYIWICYKYFIISSIILTFPVYFLLEPAV